MKLLIDNVVEKVDSRQKELVEDIQKDIFAKNGLLEE